MLMEFLSSNLGLGVIISALICFLGYFWKYNWDAFKYPDKPGRRDRSRRLKMLRGDTATFWYRSVVSMALRQISLFFDDRNDFESNSNVVQSRVLLQYVRRQFDGLNPWTMRSYTYCLSLSFIYPVFGFLIPWLFGADGSLAGLKLLPQNQSYIARFLLVSAVVISCVYGWKYSRAKASRDMYMSGLIWITSTTISILLAYFLLFPITIIIGIAGISTIAAVQARASATASVGGMFVMLVLALFFMKKYDTGLPLIIAGLVFISLQIFWHWFWKFSSKRVWYIVIWQILWILVVVVSIAELAKQNSLLTHDAIENTQVMLLFFVLFPLINSPLDWISLGLTRGLLGKIRDGHHRLRAMRFAVLDVVLAAAFYALMVGVIMSTLAFVDIFWEIRNESSIHIAELLDYFSKQPWQLDFAWIHVMAAATLLPTIVHFLFSSFATVYIVSAIIARPWVKVYLEEWPRNEEMDGDSVFVANALLTGNMIVGIIIPVLIIGLTFYFLFEGPVQAYISWFAQELAIGVRFFDVNHANLLKWR